MDDKTQELLVQVAKEHPYAVMLIAALPGGTTFIMALTKLVAQMTTAWQAIRGGGSAGRDS